MSANITTDTDGTATRKGLSWPQVLIIVIVAVIATAGLTYWFFNCYLFPKEFKAVQLKPKEERVLNNKLRAMGISMQDTKTEAQPLEPERYSEIGAKREIRFSERELNAILAKNTDLAHKLAIDLSDDLISAKLLIPVEEDFPMLGGKMLRVNTGVEVAYKGNKPIVILKGISVMGVPIPNAWLGNLKNVDLVNEFGGNQGFWKAFADGIEYIQVEDGQLKVKLKE
jgi:hypothetical protein